MTTPYLILSYAYFWIAGLVSATMFTKGESVWMKVIIVLIGIFSPLYLLFIAIYTTTTAHRIVPVLILISITASCRHTQNDTQIFDKGDLVFKIDINGSAYYSPRYFKTDSSDELRKFPYEVYCTVYEDSSILIRSGEDMVLKYEGGIVKYNPEYFKK